MITAPSTQLVVNNSYPCIYVYSIAINGFSHHSNILEGSPQWKKIKPLNSTISSNSSATHTQRTHIHPHLNETTRCYNHLNKIYQKE